MAIIIAIVITLEPTTVQYAVAAIPTLAPSLALAGSVLARTSTVILSAQASAVVLSAQLQAVSATDHLQNVACLEVDCCFLVSWQKIQSIETQDQASTKIVVDMMGHVCGERAAQGADSPVAAHFSAAVDILMKRRTFWRIMIAR